MRKNITLDKTFTRKAYKKNNSLLFSIPIEITRKIGINSDSYFIVELINGMIVYKPIDTKINSKHTPKNIQVEQMENTSSKEIATTSPPQQEPVNENNDLLEIVEDSQETIDDANIDVTGVEEL